MSAIDVGGDVDAFEEVGTIELLNDAERVIAIQVAAALNATTAAEAVAAQYKFDFSDMGLGTWTFTGPPSHGQAIATNNQALKAKSLWLPCNIASEGNESIPISVSTHLPDVTGDLNVLAGVLFESTPKEDQTMPDEWWRAFPEMMAAQGGFGEAKADVTTTDEALSTITVRSWARHIVGFGADFNQNAAPRAAEDLVLGMDYRGTFGDFEPQRYVVGYKVAALGTPVGQPTYDPAAPYRFPAWIPTFGKTGKITPRTILASSVTDEHQVTGDVYWSKA